MIRRKLWIVQSLIICLFLSGAVITAPVAAQSDDELVLIDRAMLHLSDYLGRTITRNTHPWRWSEKIFPDTSLGCPSPGVVYAQQQTRGYQVWIAVDNIEYDYRLSVDGSIVILCLNNRPDPASVGIELPAQTVEDEIVESIVQPLTTASWWAWVYVIQTDSLYLLNPAGEQVRLPRPRLPGEVPGTTPKLTVSRDGRYLIVASRLNTGTAAIGFYAIETGRFSQVHPVARGEDIYLGYGYDNSSIAGYPYIVSEDNRQVAVGLANTDFSSPSWRVIVFDLVTGSALYQIDNQNPQIGALGLGVDGIVFPRVVYFGPDVIHVQLIRFAAGPGESHPTFAWHPNGNFVEASPLYLTHLDVLSSGDNAAFTYADSANPSQSNPLLPLPNVGIGQPSTPQLIFQDVNASHTAPRWGGSGRLVFFRSDQSDSPWQGLVIESGQLFSLGSDVEAVAGTPEGYLTRTRSGTVFVHTTPESASPLWQTPENTEAILLWASPPDSVFGLSRVFIPLNLTGIVHCPGTPASAVAVGMTARVAFVNALRLREAAGGTFLLTMDNGTDFLVIGGPQCQGDFTWWQVRLTDGTTGWAAEGDLDVYYMEPLPDTP